MRDCLSLPNPVNGQVKFPDTTVGSVANFSCFAGYTLNGTTTHTCEADGECQSGLGIHPLVKVSNAQ